MKLRLSRKPGKDSVLIYPVFQKDSYKNPALKKIAAQLSAGKEFEAREGQIFFAYNASPSLPKKILLLGLGKGKKLKTGNLMGAFASAINASHSHHPARVAVMLPEKLTGFAGAIASACVLANYNPSRAYKTGKNLKKLGGQSVKEIEFVAEKEAGDVAHELKKALAISQTVNDVRDWVNAPPGRANAVFFEERSREIAETSKSRLTILKKKELEKLGMGALLAVNQGSSQEARLILIDYSPPDADKNKKPIAFVGKGILFDSGGYNLKPSGYIEDMQLDKAGAATVIALMGLLPLLGVKRRIIAVAPFTENLIGPNAIKPSDIIKTYSGKTVEITNTDAEGRLILCDAVAYAVDKYKPEYVIDLATLTGACMIALGERYAGLFTNNKGLEGKLRDAGKEVDELLWPLPIHRDFAAKVKGYYADLRNSDSSERYAGASKGAAFIREFVGKTPWAHLDIAGPAFVKDPKKYEQKGATGFGVRLLARFLEKLEGND